MYSQSKKNFCFSYTRPGYINNIPSSKTLLLKEQKQFLDCTTKNTLDSTLNNIIQNQGSIQTNITGQLESYAINRNNTYVRLPPPFIPPSVIQLQMETATVGLPKTIIEPCSGK
jgi:hypothetical protein